MKRSQSSRFLIHPSSLILHPFFFIPSFDMFISSLAEKLFSNRNGNKNHDRAVERICSLIRSSSDLNEVFHQVAEDIGRSLDLPHVAIILSAERKMKGSGSYYATDLSYNAREDMRLLDQEISRELVNSTAAREMSETELDQR